MVDLRRIREVVQRVVGEVVEGQMALVRQQVIERVTHELEPEFSGHAGSQTDLLHAAVVSVQDANTQGEILRALLDGAARFCGRVGLLVVRGGMATGWQSRGFDNDEIFKIVSLDCSRGLAARVVQSRIASVGSSADFDQNFLFKFGAPADGNLALLPLVVKEKVSALIYADTGAHQTIDIDHSALQLLARYAGLWLEVVSARKTNGPGYMQEAVAEISQVQANAFESPQAMQAAAGAGFVQHEQPAPVAVIEQVSEPEPVPTPVAVAEFPAQDDEQHKKARRFARLLVDEIRLYNQSKVADGRQNRDVYDRLKDDIEKSRATYQRRYGQSITDADYFTDELVRILADNDPAVMGGSFSR